MGRKVGFLSLLILLVCSPVFAAQRTDRLDLTNGSAGVGKLRLYEDTDDGAHSTTIQPVAMAADITYTLPPDDGDANEVLSTNGSGVLTWEAGGGGSGDITSVGDVASGAAFDGTQGTTITFNNAGGDGTIDYDGTDFSISKPITVTGVIDTTSTIQAGSGNITITNATGNLDGTKIADADLGQVSFASGVATVEDVTCTNCLTNTEVASADLATNVSDTDFGDITVSSGAWAVEDNSHAHTTTTISGLVNANLSGTAGITLANTAITAGRSLTIATNDILADAELYTHTFCYRLPASPVATDDDKSIWINDSANGFTVTKLWCESDQTVTMMLQVDDGTPADMDSVDLACISTPDTDTSLDGDATIAAGDRVDVDVASVSGTPTWGVVCFTGTYDD